MDDQNGSGPSWLNEAPTQNEAPPYDLSSAAAAASTGSNNSSSSNSSSAPSWTQPPAAAPPAQAPAPAPTHGPTWTQPAAQVAQAAAVAQAKEAAKGVKSGLDAEVNIPTKLKATISFLHVLCAFFIGLASVLNLMGSPAISQAIVCVYLFAFGVLICGFEMGYGLKAISDAIDGNCGFIQHAAGRTAFLLLVGMLAFALGTWGIVGGSLCFAAAGMNMYAAIAFQKCCKGNGSAKEAAGENYTGPGSAGFTASSTEIANPVLQQAQPRSDEQTPHWTGEGEDL